MEFIKLQITIIPLKKMKQKKIKRLNMISGKTYRQEIKKSKKKLKQLNKQRMITMIWIKDQKVRVSLFLMGQNRNQFQW